MYLRRPLVQRGAPLRRLTRRSAPEALLPSAPLTTSTSSSDFGAYVQAECTDTLLSQTHKESSADAATTPSLSSSPSPAPRRTLHCGHEVAALPATAATLNHINAALWLPVLTRLHHRGALSSADCAGAVRHLPAFTFRSLLPWLWAPADGGGAAAAPYGEPDASSLCRARSDDVAVDVYENLSLVALEQARHQPPSRVSGAAAPSFLPGEEAAARGVTTASDVSTAPPRRWCGIAQALIAALPQAAPHTQRLKVWHDVFFALRSHESWSTTAAELRDVAHPQLMRLLSFFYADMCEGGSDGATVHDVEEGGRPTLGAAAGAAAQLEVGVLMPPIILRHLRAHYRRHPHSAMLFAELYELCIAQEERTVAVAGAPPTLSMARGGAGRLRTTSLLMDVDLAAHYASLPGRRHSGLSTPQEQWQATLRHLAFLLPRVHLLQQCQQLSPPSSSSSSSVSQTTAARGKGRADPLAAWRRVAAVVMNVCMWVENNNAEATRCCSAVWCTIDALDALCSSDGVHALLGTPNAAEVRQYVSTLLEAARSSMRAKAQQLNYGPQEGLFGVYLLSVAASVVLPPVGAAAEPRSSPAQQHAAQKDGQPERGSGRRAKELLQELRMWAHPSKSSPRQVWAALRRLPRAADGARYGLVTVGYHLYADCVLPLAGHPAKQSAARRLCASLCAWASEVGRPLRLDGRSVLALWRLRWSADHQRAAVDGTASALQRLAAMPEGGCQEHPSATNAAAARERTWQCGCGFRNESGDAVVTDCAPTSCVACVLRELVPHSWECPACHTVARSGVHVPYCLHCGEEHPALSCQEQPAQPFRDADGRDATRPAATLLHVCTACSTIVPFSPQRPAESIVHLEASPRRCCSSCGSDSGGFVTAAFAWTCGCGAEAAATQAFCHDCARAAQAPAYTCPQCQHAQTDISSDRCSHCSHPHPRRLALCEHHRLVHCPACQGLVAQSSTHCPHCTSTAVAAVAALLPTLADRPLGCLHCGHTQPLRDAETGQLKGPSITAGLYGLALPVPSPTAPPCAASPARGVAQRCTLAEADELHCAHCGAARLPAAAFEPMRLWSCEGCGAPYNSEAACRRCAALHPAVPPASVHVWRCGVCEREHPSWVTSCDAAGCGGGATGGARFCYSPWECVECGAVTLSSHLPSCASCGAAVPAEVASLACTSLHCTGAAHDETAAAANSADNSLRSSAADGPSAEQRVALARPDPATRLAEVEAFLLSAADTDGGLVPAVADASLWPTLTALARTDRQRPQTPPPAPPPTSPPPSSTRRHGGGQEAVTSNASMGSEEGWEDAYRAVVMSF